MIAYLLQGGTLRELGIPVSAFQHVRFAFDASRIAFDSPFFAKIRPYIPFEYDKKVGLGTLLSALSLIIALKGPVGPPTVHPEPAHPAKIGIEAIAKTRPSVSPSMVQVGQLFYQSTLGRADFAEIQRALYLAGFEPGAIDGQKGSRTKKAAEGLQKAGIAFKGYDDPAFLNALSLRLANKFPFFAQEP
ncbi:MAG TPA: peptidoglycan-binding domain-containing protein [Chthoniobacterales bacterium]|nr:peptidoglycan-binding domain-containing protein [Chthoniobacterales bacterium]